MVRGKGNNESAKLQGIKKFVDRSVGLFRKAKIRHMISTEIREIKSRVVEVHERRRRYEVNLGADKSVMAIVDPRLLFAQHTEVKELVGIDETRDELIKIMMEENRVPMQQGKIVSIVGFGGLGKTTLANVVYDKIRPRFDCCAFVSVSQTPDLKKLFNSLLSDLDENFNKDTLDEWQLIKELREFLGERRYLIVIVDIWDILVWKMIKTALPDNNVGYIIITTTRNISVAEQAGGVYKLKPLSLNNSRKLLFRRIFSNESKDSNEELEECPNEELAEVSDRIAKKCAGIPLAIIMMASLLACKARNKLDWYEVYNSVGAGLESNLDVENMRKILSFSYYDMPCHLRTCLLYLSVFPEDYKIAKQCLIWMWVAEGFIQYEKQGNSIFELGESYFNELINRSMIEPIYDEQCDTIYACRVHDMVLDLICYLSSEENFVTLFNGIDHRSPSNNIRRLSLQNGQEDQSMFLTTRSLKQVRSVVVFQSGIAQIPVLKSFRVLRVLDLRSCDLSQGYDLKYLGDLVHLRYLGLYGTGIARLPEEIGYIQFLQTLDIKDNDISSLPSTVVKLRHLMCLYTDESTRVPNGMGSLTSLEELSDILIDDSTVDIIEELGHLTKLMVLVIFLPSQWNGKLVECLHKLQKIQRLVIVDSSGQRLTGGLDSWVAARHLRDLYTGYTSWFSTLPAWMNPSFVPDLTILCIAVRELQQADLEILGRLPALRYVELKVAHEDLGIPRGFVVGDGSFVCLVRALFRGFVGPIVFQQGAMPRLRTLWSKFSVLEATEIANGLDLGLGNLPLLQDVWIRLDSGGASEEEVEELKAALRHAARTHPNHPRLDIC
ncbi:unnamed protein product [Urochloa decumbens]|uniref:NB-ARC domain-containing protein n=1 Tax=Urochloa decumbens TaxID=240449 RepID=A0ABC9B042_9POAL